ncbi:hypothetical protein C8A05DRAFT_42923 [Staphylotrichum tortipilum]|uniref:Transmembrane protein n=1 Tax=Staphylotrichum tortipilum TaxID=2831512 RepID=A0AAN6RVT0_9PEZI|nr:hypothetical protein C8A05DRAFT_42923 [Staphylotrichum longicolle]
MLPGVLAHHHRSALALFIAASSLLPPSCAAVPWTRLLSRGTLIFDYSPAPSPEDGPPASANALRDPAFLPAQIGGIVGAYAFSLVLVALLLLALSKTRRNHLRNRDNPPVDDGYFFDFDPFPEPYLLEQEEEYHRQLEQFQKLSLQIPQSPIRNFSLPSASPLSPTRTGPLSPTKSQLSAFTTSSPTSTVLAAGVDLSVDQTVVSRDRAMAQQQLEEMYRHVMEQEQAKAEGREYHGPTLPSPSTATSASPVKSSGGLKKGRNKPTSLNLAKDEKSASQSRGSSLFAFLKSPRKNKMGAPGMSISSPIMTPMSGTFPRHDGQEMNQMNPMSPRHYAPPAAPPVSTDLPFRRAAAAGGSTTSSHHLPTPDISPVSTQSIDSRIDAAIGPAATFQLPPFIPAPGSTTGSNTAVRAGGALPLRAYQPSSLSSPTAASFATKQTVFTRAGPMSPGGGLHTGGMRTPWTGAPVPYTPYQPFSPVVPITPSVVTKADRKRMKRMEPKTPTVEMVRDADDIW